MESSASGSSKRARAPGNGTQVPSCLVDGCAANLAKCRDYHRRHKVCEIHSKTARVTIHGQEQRFCQQCSRFHSLVEFDDGKRSCRKRLDLHNRRRRKPQPNSLSINSGSFFSEHQGTEFIPFGSPQVISAGLVTPAWTGIVKAKTDVMLHNHIDFSIRNLFDGSSSHYKGGKQFPFLEGGVNSTVTGASIRQPLLSAHTLVGDGGSSQKLFSNGLHQLVNSSCAHSLLSSPQSATREIGLSHMVRTHSIPPAQSLIPNLTYGMDGEPIVSALVADSSSNANLHGRGEVTYQIGADGSSQQELSKHFPPLGSNSYHLWLSS